MKKWLILLIILSSGFSLLAKADTTTEERIIILSDVWRNVRDNFAFPEHFASTNPDSLFEAFVPKVLNADSEKEFANLMTEFLAKFKDGHTRFFAPTSSGTIPIKFTGIEGKAIVKNIGKTFAKEIPIGSQLIKIDGTPIEEYLSKIVYPYVAAPNEDWLFRKSLESFLEGDITSEVTLEFRTPKGKNKSITFHRVNSNGIDSCDWAKQEDNRVAYVECLPNNISYMKMAIFTNPQETQKVFFDNLHLFQSCNGLIFDIRGNRGGSDEGWDPIFDYVAPNDVDKQSSFTAKCRVANSAFQEYGDQIPQLKSFADGTAMEPVRSGSYFSQIPDSLKIKCPIILLIDGYTGSAAEDFAVTMKNLGLAKLVGTHTVGVISHPRYFDLPKGYSYGLSTWAFTNPDGASLIDNGIIPDIEVEYTVDDFIKGNDPQLDKALLIFQNIN